VPLENLEMSETGGNILPSQLSSDAHSSHDILRRSVLDLSFARNSPAGESGAAPPNRRASEVGRKRPKLTLDDRLLWVLLSRLWSDWRSVLAIVKPETVVAWHRAGFRLFWTWKVRHGQLFT
jgi:hypothetical protein